MTKTQMIAKTKKQIKGYQEQLEAGKTKMAELHEQAILIDRASKTITDEMIKYEGALLSANETLQMLQSEK